MKLFYSSLLLYTHVCYSGPSIYSYSISDSQIGAIPPIYRELQAPVKVCQSCTFSGLTSQTTPLFLQNSVLFEIHADDYQSGLDVLDYADNKVGVL